MAIFPGLKRLVRVDRGRASVNRAVDDELQFHLDMTIAELMAGGMAPDDARAEAVRRFGAVGPTRDRLAAIDRSRVTRTERAARLAALSQDLAYAIRGLRRRPMFAASVIVTLGLGIGANATMFGIVDRLLFRPPNGLIAADRVGRLYFSERARGTERVTSYTGYRRYLDLRASTQAFDAITPFTSTTMAVGSGEAVTEVHIGQSGAELWKMFDVTPVIGRFFVDEENALPTGSRVVVLAAAFWKTRYGADPNVLGKTLEIGPAPYTIIGVAPEGFNAFERAPLAAFVPIVAATASTRAVGDGPDASTSWYDRYAWSWFELFVRRRSAVDPRSANADVSHAYQQSYRSELDHRHDASAIADAHPRAFIGSVLADRGPNEGRDAKVATWLAGVAAMVMLIACANVTNLLLFRALARRREIAVRIALGISRGRLVLQLLTESLLLCTLGAALGVVIAQLSGHVLERALLRTPPESPRFVDLRIAGFAAVLTLLATVVTGIAPLADVRRANVADTLKAGSRSGHRHRSALRSGLLAGQAALSVIMLVGAGLFLRSFSNVRSTPLGYTPDHVLWLDVETRGVTLDSARQVQLRNTLVDAARQVPGVTTAARALAVPFWDTWQYPLFVSGIDSVRRLGNFNLQTGGPDFFAAIGTRVLRGRGFIASDRAGSARVMVVSEGMANKLWPTSDALGKCVRLGSDTMPCSTVVGIAQDVRQSSMSEPDLRYYVPMQQFQPRPGGLFIRTAGRAADRADDVRRRLQQSMPGTSYVTVTPLAAVIASQTRSWRMGALMFTAFGLLALVLAAIGLYSVVAYTVAQRTHEMGVRVALGAERSDVIALVIREGITAITPGLACGALITLVSGRAIAPLLFGVSPHDPMIMAGVVCMLVTVAIASSWIPARRAASADPNIALRAD